MKEPENLKHLFRRLTNFTDPELIMIAISEIIAVLPKYISETKKEKEIEISENTDILTDLDLDSVDIMQFLSELEEKYDISFIELEDFYTKFRTVSGLKSSIEELLEIKSEK